MRRTKLLKIIETYGTNHQLKKLHEEVYELTEAILEYEEGVCPHLFDKEAVTEEYADVMVLLNQLLIKYEIDNVRVNEIMEEKIDRQIERIKKEQKVKPNPTKLQVGDTIKCSCPEEMVELMNQLQKDGIETDFVYYVNGVRGLYLEVVKIEN